MNARDDRTDLRQRLYANGFTPLPNRNKMCLLKGWSTVDVTPELIDSWGGRRADEQRFKDTGLRCGDIVALDWDIDDADLLNELLDEVVGQGIVEESPFVRIGKPPRELWVYRTADKIGKRTTGHFMPAGSEEGNGFAVEVLGAGCQFAAYGQRDDETEYTWTAESLLDHTYMDLPEITQAQVDALKDFCTTFFESHGLERRSPGGGTDAGYSHVYDLTTDMLFEVKELGEHTLEDLQAILRLNPEEVLRCKVDPLRPTSGSWAGMISLVGGKICLSDHGTYTTHFLIEDDLQRGSAELGKLLMARATKNLPKPGSKLSPKAIDLVSVLDPRAPFDDTLALCLKRFAYIKAADSVFDLRHPEIGVPVSAFRNAMLPFYRAEKGRLGAEKIVRIADMFMQHPDRIEAMTISMRPDRSFPLYYEGGEYHLNTYQPPALPDNLGDASVGFDFLEQLLPIAREREFFTRWLAHKVRHPEKRGVGIIMVAHDKFGTGRGSLVQLLKSMFCPRLVRNVDFKTLSGQTYQSQYNDWMVDSLFIAVDEAQETSATVSRWQAKSNAYEHLKTLVEPGNIDLLVVRKGLPNYQARTYASVLVMTNHIDALIMPAGDRRFAVLENGEPRDPSYWSMFRAWQEKPENIAAFIAGLNEIDLSDYDPFANPIMTSAKTEMIDSGASDLDRAVAHALNGLDGALVVKDQILLRIEDYAADNDIDMPDDWRRMAERLFHRKTRRVPEGLPERIRLEGKQRVVRAVGLVKVEGLQTSEAVLAKILEAGPVVRPIKSSGQVVRFPGGGERKPA